MQRIRKLVTYANVMSTIAVMLALGGTAYAALKVTGRNVVDRSLTGADLKSSAVATRQLKNLGVKSVDIAGGAVTSSKIAANAVDSAIIATGSVGAADLAAPAYAIATDTTTASIADATWTTLSFDTEQADSAEIHSTAINPERFTAPRDGVYLATARIRWSDTAQGLRWNRIVHYDSLGVEIDSYGESLENPSGAFFSGPEQAHTEMLAMNSGDYLQMEVRQDREPVDGSITLSGDPRFTLAYLGATS